MEKPATVAVPTPVSQPGDEGPPGNVVVVPPPGVAVIKAAEATVERLRSATDKDSSFKIFSDEVGDYTLQQSISRESP